MGGDSIDHAPDSIGTVEECRWAAYKFYSVQSVRVSQYTMVARTTTEVTGSNTILHDEDSIAIEAADDRAA